MEKRKPHHPLAHIKSLIQAGAFRVTRTALKNAARDFGFVEANEIARRILLLNARDFYKSMTTIHDSSRWQDVYQPEIEGVLAYVKVQIVEESSVVISFKALEDE